MKVFNMVSSKGNKIANQFIINDEYNNQLFQSYNSIIAKRYTNGMVELDKKYWNFSKTTSKYRNMFLDESNQETNWKVKIGVYKLVDLN
tara:strand:+ start:1465 stop:1731 length:267 start_codon:yes stop_codon:yes gene_type:complete